MINPKPVDIKSFGAGIPVTSAIKDLRKLPRRDWNVDVTGIRTLLVLPALKRGGMHDSGYRCLEVVACSRDTAYCVLTQTSDVIHLGGIGGRGNRLIKSDLNKWDPQAWAIDCIHENGAIQLFTLDAGIRVGPSLSSLEVW